MAVREINFLEENLRKAAQQAKEDRRYLIIGLVALAVVIVVWLGLIAYNYYLSSQTEKLNVEAQALDTQLLAFSAGQVDYLTFINKVKAISDIIGLRHDAVPLMTEAADYLTTEDIMLSSINYSMEENVFTMNYILTNVFEAQKFYLSLLDPDFRAKFQGIDYGALNRNQDGTYSTSVAFNI